MKSIGCEAGISEVPRLAVGGCTIWKKLDMTVLAIAFKAAAPSYGTSLRGTVASSEAGSLTSS